MSVTELPLHAFFQRSSSFCSSVRSDLDRFMQEVENEFSSISREIKIAPGLRRKSTLVNIPGSCTLDLKEFTRSKENALRNLKTSFSEMQLKWASTAEELKDWFFMNMESCLAKIQLEVKVTSEELNLTKPVLEVDLCDESSSSSSEIVSTPVRLQNARMFHALRLPVASAKKNGKRTDRVQVRKAPNAPGCGEEKIVKISRTLSTSVGKPDVENKRIEWRSFLSAIEDSPSKPGIYEMKVWNAKNPAYIGHCDDIKKCLSVHSEGRPSGNKNLNAFIRRNKGEMSIRYMICPSVQLAKLEQKRRLQEFLETHKKLPSYNYRV